MNAIIGSVLGGEEAGGELDSRQMALATLLILAVLRALRLAR